MFLISKLVFKIFFYKVIKNKTVFEVFVSETGTKIYKIFYKTIHHANHWTFAVDFLNLTLQRSRIQCS